MGLHTDGIQEISREGFQVVSVEMFQCPLRSATPSMTIWNNSISFNKAALTALNNCERVRIEINVEKRMVLLVPVTAKDKDNVRWLKAGKEPQARRIDCSAFTTLLYKNWGWDKENVYRASGRVVTSEKKVMLLFEFEDTETWKFGGTAKGKKDG